MENLNKVGRPAGSGAQLPPGIRARQSRQSRKAAGAARIEIMMEAETLASLEQLMAHWGCGSRKEAIARAVQLAATAISR